MTALIIGSVFLGIIFGKLGLFVDAINNLDLLTTLLLNFLLFVVGLDLGHNKAVWKKFTQLGWKIILLPFSIALGSIIGAALVAWVVNLEITEAMAVGAGFGWYSLSGVLLAKLSSVELGTIAFLSNVFRELMAVILIPIIASRFGGLAAVAPGGATTMDTTLPIISKAAGQEMVIIAFINGIVLTSLVPIIVPFLISF